MQTECTCLPQQIKNSFFCRVTGNGVAAGKVSRRLARAYTATELMQVAGLAVPVQGRCAVIAKARPQAGMPFRHV